MTSGITISSAMRANLLSLQNTQTLLGDTQFRLATGKKINSALDNPTAFFAAQALNTRASNLSSLLDGMGQSIQTIKAADQGITGITTILNSAKAILNTAREAADGADVSAQVTQYASQMAQLDLLIQDAGYKGINLLNNDTLTTVFNEDGTSTQAVTNTLAVPSAFNSAGLGLDTTGASLTADGTGAVKVSATDNATIDAEIAKVNTALTNMQGQAAGFGAALGVIQVRETFTKNLVNILQEGADKLVLTDKNEEAANLLSLQTTQQLGIQALSLSSQANQSVLRLFQ